MPLASLVHFFFWWLFLTIRSCGHYCCAQMVTTATVANANTISYVMEPFDDATMLRGIHDNVENNNKNNNNSHNSNTTWFKRLYNNAGKLSLSVVPNSLFGTGALQIEYTVQTTESWGGFVDFGSILKYHHHHHHHHHSDSSSSNTKNEASSAATTTTTATHNCHGATHLSLHYKVVRPQSNAERVHLRVILLDDSNCGVMHRQDEKDNTTVIEDDDDVEEAEAEDMQDACWEPPGQALENYYTFHYILDDTNAEWHELIMPLAGGSSDPDAPFWRTGWTGQVGNDRLDLNGIKGWRIELSMDSQGGMNSTSSGVLLVDQLQCVGGNDLLGAAFWTNRTHTLDQVNTTLTENATIGVGIAAFESANAAGTWFDRYYESPISRNLSSAALVNGTLKLNYTIAQSEAWGGFVDYQHIAPGSAYYNLSAATAVSLSYTVRRAASVAERAHLRLILMDSSDCTVNCSLYPGQNLENYYSFHYVLDGEGNAQMDISVELQGSSNSSSPFWRPGWTGQVGNDRLDKERLKGFRLELNLDSQGEVGSLVSGAVDLANLLAIVPTAGSDDIGDTNETKDASLCVTDPDLMFHIDLTLFKRKEFVRLECCEICDADDDCLYAISDGKDCYMAPFLKTDSVGLVNTEFFRATRTAFVTNNSTKRGYFCDKCLCREEERAIDCRGKGLRIIPKQFLLGWKPRLLDLRDNPNIVVIDSNAFSGIADELEEILLPASLRHISFETVKTLPKLTTIRVEGQEEDEAFTTTLNNAISEPSGFFGDVCCDRGEHIDLKIPNSGLTYCDMKVDSPGLDSIYEPFELYIDAKSLHKLRPSSSFMGEAAESLEKCAEYCTISDKCRYFSYDARRKESEHTCILLENNGTKSDRECCEPDHYADDEGTVAGFTSGRPPRSRYEDDRARVIIAPQDLILSKMNGYSKEFEVSLGSSPLRGAVWIEPKLITKTHLNVSIEPRRVVLYTNTSATRISVTINNPETLSTGKSLLISNQIASCDAAFTSASTDRMAELSSVYVDAVPEEQMSYLTSGIKAAGILYVALQFIFTAFFLMWTIYFRDQVIVRKSQPVFLILVLIGCFIVSTSILPTIAEEAYPYVQDPANQETTDVPNDDIDGVNAACMAFPWLFNVGFTITFSSLFAKIWRVHQILIHAASLRRTTVEAKDVAIIMVIFLSIQIVLLLIWQLVDPLKWQREVIKYNDRGYAIESVGRCSSENSLSFAIPIAVFDFGCLLIALYLCYVTRNVPSDLNEGRWLTASIISILQVLLLTVPVLVIAWDDPNAFFFVRATAVFLVSMGVSCFIFLPKFYQLHFVPEANSRRSSIYISRMNAPSSPLTNSDDTHQLHHHHRPSRTAMLLNSSRDKFFIEDGGKNSSGADNNHNNNNSSQNDLPPSSSLTESTAVAEAASSSTKNQVIPENEIPLSSLEEESHNVGKALESSHETLETNRTDEEQQ